MIDFLGCDCNYQQLHPKLLEIPNPFISPYGVFLFINLPLLGFLIIPYK